MRSLGWLAAGALLLFGCGGGGDDGNLTPTANTPPTADFEWTCAELTCSFTDASTDADGSVTAWSWDFGDDATATDQNPVHTYDAAQSYSVTLTATDNSGATNATTLTVEPEAPSTDFTCTDATTAGGAATCSFTLPAAAGVKAVLDAATTCEAGGNSFKFTAPVAATLTTNGCFDPGAQVELAGGPFSAGTQVTAEVKSGLKQYRTGVRVTGEYPAWTLHIEDAVGATFPEDYDDMVVTVTALP